MVAPPNRHDTKLLEATLQAIVVDRPVPTDEHSQHLCLDKEYDNPTGLQAAEAAGVRPIGEEPVPPETCTYPPRLWVVEACLGWLSLWRNLLVRYEKKAPNYSGAKQLTCGLLWHRRLWRLQWTLDPQETEF